MFDPIFVVEMLLLGVAVGLISAALGLGGGIFMVPAFIAFVPGMDAHTAKGTSLFIIIFVSALNAWRFTRDVPDAEWRLAATVSCGSIVGGYLGGWFTSLLPDAAVIWIFIGLLAFVGVRTFSIRARVVRPEEVRERVIASISIGLVAGVIGGATGTGGGAVLVPLGLMAGIVSNERAVALSNMVMVATSIAGTLAHLTAQASVQLPWTWGHVCFSLAPLVFVGSQLAIPFARPLHDYLTLPRRKLVMGVVLLLMTARLIYQTLK
jgi:hypothetical protein